MAASNSHILFCFCNLIIAILLLGSSKPSSEEKNTNLDSHIFKRRESLGTSKPKCCKSMNLDFKVKTMDTTCVSSSQELCKFQLYNSSTMIENFHQGTNFQNDTTKVAKGQRATQRISHSRRVQGRAARKGCDTTKVAIAKNGSTDRKMHLAKMRKEINANNFEKCDDKEEDELRRRIEEFIEKVNRGWRAEKLGICYQSQ